MTGIGGGKLATTASDCVVVPSDDMQAVEDAHMAIVHGVMRALRDEA